MTAPDARVTESSLKPRWLASTPVLLFRSASFCLTLLVMGVGAVMAQDWSVDREADWCERGDWKKGSQCEVRTATLPASGRLVVDPGKNGGISVEGWDRSEVEVTVKVQAHRGTDAADIEIHAQGDQLEAVGPRSGDWGASFRIKVPRNYDLELEARNGGLKVAGVAGDLRLDTHNGGISLSDVGGTVWARTMNGGLDIDLAGSTWSGEGLDAKTTNGGIALSVPAGYSAELETGTVNGRVSVDFPVTVQGDLKSRVRTTLGSGGPLVSVVTTNGSVKVREGR